MNPGDKIAIIGAGASGLAAAVSLARRGAEITVYEHKPEPGLKILITGHGKCNLTNTYIDPECYYASSESRIADYLKRFSAYQAIEFFNSIGIETYEKNGFVYPVSNNAATVRDALYDAAIKLNVRFEFNCGELDIQKLHDKFNSVILACGSSACKKTGSNGTGYSFLRKLGVSYSRILPALCPLYVDENDYCNKNSGRRVIATVTAFSQGRILAEDTGEIQLQKDRLTGVPIFQISRFVSMELDNGNNCELVMDMNPDMNKVPEFIRPRYQQQSAEVKRFTVSRISRFDNAQVCMGGVPLDGLNEDFELKQVPGVYVIGEMCDVDGKCGGYNLHWAWLSANLCCK